MKKLITKYWGLVLVVVLLSSLFLVGAPASAANYAWATASVVPTALTGLLAPAGFTGIKAVAQSGSVIYAVGADAAINYLYKSADGGATWVRQTTSITANTVGANDWTLLAVAPDDPNIVVLVDTTVAPDVVYISTTGGTLFSALTTVGQVATINSIAISPMTTARYLAIGGGAEVDTWTLNLVSPAWTNRAAVLGASFTNVLAVAFSPNFAADNGLLAVTTNGTVDTTASIFSFNSGLGWNPVGYDFPRVIHTNTLIAGITKATIALDPNFYLGDLSQQIGFVALVSTNATAGGVYRFDPTALFTQIYSTQSVNSIAWDGTNLLAAPNDVAAGGALSILRSSTAYSTVPAFLPSSVLKTPGTGTNPLVLFNGGNAFAFSQGQNSAIAKSTDLGKSFNGFALVVSNFNTISDIWVSPDGTRVYAAVFDGTDVDVWRRSGTVWQRVMIMAAPAVAQQVWLVRADADAPDTVFLGNKGATLMYKSTDAGEATWTIRGMAANIADFAVQDANTVFALSNGNANVYKSATGAFTWTAIPVAFLTGNGYSINLLKDNSLVIGTTTGVAYSNDGAAFTTCLSTLADLTAGNMVVTATGTAAGDTIFVGSSGGMLAKWVIGTSTNWGAAAGTTYAKPIHGIAYANGILYAFDDTNNATYRYITPTVGIYAPFVSDTKTTAMQAAQATRVNELTLSQGSNILWAVDQIANPDDIFSYTDLMIGAAAIPTPTYPTNNTIIPVNSLSGNTNPFNFMWTVPSATAPAAGYSFNVRVYLDEAGTIPYAGDLGTAVSPASFTTGVVAASGLGTTAFIGTPGVTYYWRVRVATLAPELGAWSAMQSFNVQQLQAIVPTLSSPVNGSSIGQAPAFSWNPIAAATSYTFQLATDASFATTVYTTTATAAGISLPATVTPLKPGTTYFWRVKTLTPAAGEWSTVANFTVALPVTTVAPITIPPAVTPIVTVSIPAATTTVITIPPPVTNTTEVNPSYIWAIIIIGAVLVIAVIVLIVRTRRSV